MGMMAITVVILQMIEWLRSSKIFSGGGRVLEQWLHLDLTTLQLKTA